MDCDLHRDSMRMLFLKAAAIWLLVLLCAVLNGGFREAFLLSRMERDAAFLLSGVLLSICIVAATVLSIQWLGLPRKSRALAIGLFWLCLTLAFEFGFGRLVQHKTWPQLLEAYTFKDGNIWPLVLVVTFFAPLIATRLRGGT
jgi:hypothetical protein